MIKYENLLEGHSYLESTLDREKYTIITVGITNSPLSEDMKNKFNSSPKNIFVYHRARSIHLH
jgi:hypothetical protein